MGLPRSVLIVRLYPPVPNVPPAARISRNVFPPSVLISSTPPSKPTVGSLSDASRLKLCRNVSVGGPVSKNDIDSELSLLSLTAAGSSINAALGGVSAGGVGTPLLEVTQRGADQARLSPTSLAAMLAA